MNLLTSHATVSFHRVTSDSMSVGNHQICCLLIMMKRFKLISYERNWFSVICCEELKMLGGIRIQSRRMRSEFYLCSKFWNNSFMTTYSAVRKCHISPSLDHSCHVPRRRSLYISHTSIVHIQRCTTLENRKTYNHEEVSVLLAVLSLAFTAGNVIYLNCFQ